MKNLTMNKKYTKKQIREAIQYWERQLIAEELFDQLHARLRKYNNKLNEAEERSLANVKDEVLNTVKKPEDVKKIVRKYDGAVRKSNDSFLRKAWECLKTIVSAGGRGLIWIAKHWKIVLLILIVAACWYFGTGPVVSDILKMALKAAVKVMDIGVNAVADGLVAITGPEYLAAGEKISNAAIEAGGFGGWSGAGLGGGLR